MTLNNTPSCRNQKLRSTIDDFTRVEGTCSVIEIVLEADGEDIYYNHNRIMKVKYIFFCSHPDRVTRKKTDHMHTMGDGTKMIM